MKSSNKPLSSAKPCELLLPSQVDIRPKESIHIIESGNLSKQHILLQYINVFEGLSHIGRVATDLFMVRWKNYLKILEYYSDFVEVSELEDTTAQAIVEVLREKFIRYGVPDTVVSDNGPQYISQDFHNFSVRRQFTLAPNYPKFLYGKAESSVKVMKHLFKKANQDGKDSWLAPLD